MEVPNLLEEAKQIFNERGAVYGKNYYQAGKLLTALFPEGISLRTEDEFLRFITFYMVLLKAGRYAQVLARGEFHKDTIMDMGLYSFILGEVDHTIQEELENDMPF